MTKSKCLYCGVEIESPYNFPYKYCPETNHKILHKKKIQPTIKCFRCNYVWVPRHSMGLPAICPNCKSRDYGKEVNPKPKVEYDVCHNCNGLKKAASIVCRVCRQPNTEITHYCGIPRKYHNMQMAFLEKYEGNAADVLEFKTRLFGTFSDMGELGEGGRPEKNEESLSGTLESALGKSPVTSEISEPKNEDRADEEKEREVVEEEISPEDVSGVLDSLEWGDTAPELERKEEGS